eukprot:g5330.t1
MGECTLDLKHYLTYVAAEQAKIDVTTEIPMTNKKLAELLQDRRDSKLAKSEQLRRMGLDNLDTDGLSKRSKHMARARQIKRKQGPDELNARLLDELDTENDQLRAQADAERFPPKVPPCAKIVVNVQVLTQAEADQDDKRVGLGRDNPNRDPVLPFPATGRSWDAVLPAAKVLLDAVADAVEALRSGGCCACYIVIFLSLMITWVLYPDPDTECMWFIQFSCCDDMVCGQCNIFACTSAEASSGARENLCYYAWYNEEQIKDYCGTQCGGTCADEPKCATTCFSAGQGVDISVSEPSPSPDADLPVPPLGP